MRALKAIITAFGIAGMLAQGACSHNNSEDKGMVANFPKKEIRELSYAIADAPTYRAEMKRKILSLEDSLANAPDASRRFDFSLRLARTFRPINTDSALFYAHKAVGIAEGLSADSLYLAEIAVVDALSTAGLFTEATGLFSSLEPSEFPMSLKIDYWTAGRRLYAYMKSYVLPDQHSFARYEESYQQYDDSLLRYLPADVPLRAFIQCERMVTEKRYLEASEGLTQLLSQLPQESNLYGMAAFQMAEVWKNRGDDNRYAAFLALSAMSDVKGCVTEGLALPTLADWLYSHGELNDAFAFINFALEEASSANARMRAVAMARLVPIIDDAYRDKINSSRNELLVYFILVTILLIITVMLTIFLSRQIKKSRADAAKLEQTSRRQESYIANFIGLYSSYADRFNSLTKLVSTKLAAGQVAELKKLIDSGKYSDGENEDIHKIFDSAFLDIYPDFVGQINTLMRPEEAIATKGDGSLTPELRIYAFVKLGIDESTRIAQILHYSINTVYTYRNKMRNKAISRDTFDADVKNL